MTNATKAAAIAVAMTTAVLNAAVQTASAHEPYAPPPAEESFSLAGLDEAVRFVQGVNDAQFYGELASKQEARRTTPSVAQRPDSPANAFDYAPAPPSQDLAERERFYSNPANWSADWYGVAECESGNDWQTNTGNGYFGGLQENMDFWRSYGDQRWARPDLAPMWAQIEAAENAYNVRGLRPWGCGWAG